jgi:hypothetical protein
MLMGGIFLKGRESGLNNGLMEAVTKLHHHQTLNDIIVKHTTVFESSPQFLNEIIIIITVVLLQVYITLHKDISVVFLNTEKKVSLYPCGQVVSLDRRL